MFLLSSFGSTKFKRNTQVPQKTNHPLLIGPKNALYSKKIINSPIMLPSKFSFSGLLQNYSNRPFSTGPKGPPLTPVVEQKIESFYKRPLPDFLIPFSSTRGKQLFRETLEKGILESYWPLAEQFHTQSEPACKSRNC